MPNFGYPIATPDQIDFETIIKGGMGGQAGNYSAGPSTFSPSGWGLYSFPALTASSFSRGLDADGAFNLITSAVAVGSDASFSWGAAVTALLHSRSYNPFGIYKFGMVTPAGVRLFFGWANLAAATILGANDPAAAQMVGIQFDTSVADVNFQFVTKDGVAPITRINTGIPADAGTYSIAIIALDSVPSIMLELRNAAGLVLARHTFLANLPASATGLITIGGVRNLTGVARAIRHYWGGGVNTRV